MAHYNRHHANLASMVRWLDDTRPTWKQTSSKSHTAKTSWDLALGYEGALALARDGWAEGASRMAQAIAKLPALETVSRRGWSVAGGSVSMGRYYSGNPVCMRTRKRESGHKPAVTLAVNVVANCDMRADAMSNYGLAIARYADELEQAGYPVCVVAVLAAQQGDNRSSHSWLVKEQGHAMQLADMAFSIGHPGCFRRLGFAALERTGPEYPGYGYASDITADDLPAEYRSALLLNGISSANYHSATPDDAIAALRETVNAMLETREAVYH